MVAVLGREMPPEPAAGVRGTPLNQADPLVHEWIVIVIGTHFAAALVARPSATRSMPSLVVEDEGYEYAITYDRALVISAAQSVVERIDAR